MTVPVRRRPGWFRLLNPLATRRPPDVGSQPEVVLSVPPVPTLLINDDWPQTARTGRIAISTTDGVTRVVIYLDRATTPADPDYLVFLAHPNRLWVRPIDGRPPALGTWLPEPPDRELAHAEERAGQKIRRAKR